MLANTMASWSKARRAREHDDERDVTRNIGVGGDWPVVTMKVVVSHDSS
jgi:hypothetical protein